VLLGEVDDFLAGHGGSGESCGHKNPLFSNRELRKN
jgi:hypothetical protein